MPIVFIFILCLMLAVPAQARPISYPGGWTIMQNNDRDVHSLHVHYSPTARHSIGLKEEYRRDSESLFTGAQFNYLLKRWNKPSEQANLYFKSGLGVAHSDLGAFDNETELAGFAGIAADWETRRYFVSYETRYYDAGKIEDSWMQKARLGVAPYVADYGDIHTWFMIEVEHEPEDHREVTVTPLVRFFKDVYLMEAGINNAGDVLFNWTVRF